jgi:hypothetical protein
MDALIGPTTRICMDYNNTWLSTLENDVSQILRKMFDCVHVITPDEQDRLALWAAKTAILIDASSGTPVIPRGFAHDF